MGQNCPPDANVTDAVTSQSGSSHRGDVQRGPGCCVNRARTMANATASTATITIGRNTTRAGLHVSKNRPQLAPLSALFEPTRWPLNA